MNDQNNDQHFMQEAIALANKNLSTNAGGPFGAVIVKDGRIIGRGNNRVTSTSDPTAHAEVVAIRDACQYLGSFSLTDCTIYTSCEPCPMCLGAIYWARLSRVVYACSKQDAATVGFDDEFIYREIDLPKSERQIPTQQILRDKSLKVFKDWESKPDKTSY